MTYRLTQIEDRVQQGEGTNGDALFLLEKVRQLREALVEAVIPLHVLRMVYEGGNTFTPAMQQAIREGISAVDEAILATQGVTHYLVDEQGHHHAKRAEEGKREELSPEMMTRYKQIAELVQRAREVNDL